MGRSGSHFTELDGNMKIIELVGKNFRLRRATDADISSIRLLVNSAYKELADKGLNYTASYQDDKITRQRISKGKAFVLELNDQIVATILYYTDNQLTQKNTAYLGQLAVSPDLKKQGLGTLLMDYCESLAEAEGFEGIQLDTAQPAEHLVSWYLKRGFSIVGETQWENKTYRSYVFEKLF
jgi:predicted N-acetyltransferase YhbS